MTAAVCSAVILLCLVIAVADGVLNLPYIQKSAVKIAVFVVVPLIIGAFYPQMRVGEFYVFPKKTQKAEKKVIVYAGVCGLFLFLLLVGGYYLLRDIIDFSGITKSLASGEGITAEKFPFVAAYIVLCNSMIEEFFFRGFVFSALKRIASTRFATIFSAAVFSLYHVAILDGWFSPLVFVLLLFALFAGGLIFNFLAEKSNTVYPSWFLHMAANLGINTIGLILFEIL